jgi:predicted nucleotidyltransferase component of viral defense system
MLNLKDLKKYIDRWQTTTEMVVREYLQNLFLEALYRMKGAEKLLFKGGTALRLIYQSPRFSEDLDFTGQNIYQTREIDDLFLMAMAEVEKFGMAISFKEAKPTTGGYLGLIHYEAYDLRADMKFEVSLRHGRTKPGIVAMVNSDLLPRYTLIQVLPEELVAGKMAALLSRHKPRDYYDLYFMLRHRELSQYVDKKKLHLVASSLAATKINFKQELKAFLPASHQLLLKDFQKTLGRELGKVIG